MGESQDKPKPAASAKKPTLWKRMGNSPPGRSRDSKPKQERKAVSLIDLFRFATKTERVFIAIGSLAAIFAGVLVPLGSLYIGQTLTALSSYNPLCDSTDSTVRAETQAKYGNLDCTLAAFRDNIRSVSLVFLALGAAQFVCCSAHNIIFSILAESQARRIRENYFRAVLSQDQGWFDDQKTGELISRMSADTTEVQDGIGSKISQTLQNMTTFIAGMVLGFTQGWKLSLVIIATLPVIAFCSYIVSWVMQQSASLNARAYARASAVATDAISAIRTVVAFGAEGREAGKYDEGLKEAESVGIRFGVKRGIGMGLANSLSWYSEALAYWYGSTLIAGGQYTAGNVIATLQAVTASGQSLFNVTPLAQFVATAQGAACELFKVLDRSSPINAFSTSGKRPSTVQGGIELRDVTFRYPSRPTAAVLTNFSLTIPRGMSVALVGSSGSGKSTVTKLIDRFYDPSEGAVLVDGLDVRDWNVAALRSAIGIVAQEPVLFNTSVFENVAMGIPAAVKEGMGEEAVRAMVVEAAKVANAHDFVSALPNGYDTVVGAQGGQLSGGQKQRVAIARAVVGKPRILLLDEATSALDTASERDVQTALENAMQGRTTIIVAHRLSTIKNANRIVVMQHGSIVESGTHDELLAKGDVYAQLVKAQEIRGAAHGSESEGGEREQTGSADTLEAGKDGSPEKVASEDVILQGLDSKREEVIELEDSVSANLLKTENSEPQPPLWKQIAELAAPHWYLYIIGVLCSLGVGIIIPVFAFLASTILNVYRPDNPNIQSEGNFWALIYVFVTTGGFFCMAGAIIALAFAGEKLTRKLRALLFASILHQEIAFFDHPKNSVGALTTKLSQDASEIQKLVNIALRSLLMTSVGVLGGIVYMFLHGWQLALLGVILFPILAIEGFLSMNAMMGSKAKIMKYLESANQIATEAITNARTVAMLNKEEEFWQRFHDALDAPYREGVRVGIRTSLGTAFGQALTFLSNAALFYVGGLLVSQGIYKSVDILGTYFALLYVSGFAGQSSFYFTSLAKARVASASIFALVNRPSQIDSRSREGKVPKAVTGCFEAREIAFSYPNRPTMQILRGISLNGAEGQMIAVVGPSGSGKSTLIALLERFYDVNSGAMDAELLNVRDWNLAALRSNLALVGQEPVLFNGSIYDNISYGTFDNDLAPSREDVEAAARMANIHDFIMTQPEGYMTSVGEKGGLLSGGQKQRIAIARALLRRPKILLLDEATSALDSESESVVEAALKVASQGRTTIAIAHRLSSIQNADVIYVIVNGLVVEHGRHSDLMDKKGHYYDLAQQQSLAKTEK
ncbi:multidrug resistance protein 1 [Gonapodya prolifera JEL478]|uniref:Multidrug resistance protein 1 n=1 Tax=Gonapodya prolifera (strain JEL478) TaxID=1344416 RepID=A0A139A8T2_GONPJ|nr:multidrug resistance protein 1 [Gonapodya prolifera JEL478]|eukprot:KXS13200.1 multidrug resistance protein 1 [Gonapodya prolifera JEL478]